MSASLMPWFLIATCVVGLIWALLKTRAVLSIDLGKSESFNSYRMLNEGSDEKVQQMKHIGGLIERGASSFLRQEYSVMGIFVLFFGIIVFFVVDMLGTERPGVSFYATIAYVIGSITSMFCGLIGMKIAVKANFRTAYQAM